MSGSRRKFDSDVSEAATAACGSGCASALGATIAVEAASSTATPAERSNLANMFSPCARRAFVGQFPVGAAEASDEARDILRLLLIRDARYRAPRPHAIA